MASSLARRSLVPVAAVPTAGGLVLADQPWQAWIGLVALVTCAFLAARFMDYRLGKAAIEKTDPAHVAAVVAAVNGHPVPGSDVEAAAGGEPRGVSAEVRTSQ